VKPLYGQSNTLGYVHKGCAAGRRRLPCGNEVVPAIRHVEQKSARMDRTDIDCQKGFHFNL